MHWRHSLQPSYGIDLCGVTLAADGAVWVAANLNRFNLGIARIPQHQASDQRITKPN